MMRRTITSMVWASVVVVLTLASSARSETNLDARLQFDPRVKAVIAEGEGNRQEILARINENWAQVSESLQVLSAAQSPSDALNEASELMPAMEALDRDLRRFDSLTLELQRRAVHGLHNARIVDEKLELSEEVRAQLLIWGRKARQWLNSGEAQLVAETHGMASMGRHWERALRDQTGDFDSLGGVLSVIETYQSQRMNALAAIRLLRTTTNRVLGSVRALDYREDTNEDSDHAFGDGHRSELAR